MFSLTKIFLNSGADFKDFLLGTSMGSQPQKHKVFKILFSLLALVEASLLIILVKKSYRFPAEITEL
jgi:hypothetical protein